MRLGLIRLDIIFLELVVYGEIYTKIDNDQITDEISKAFPKLTTYVE